MLFICEETRGTCSETEIVAVVASASSYRILSVFYPVCLFSCNVNVQVPHQCSGDHPGDHPGMFDLLFFATSRYVAV